MPLLERLYPRAARCADAGLFGHRLFVQVVETQVHEVFVLLVEPHAGQSKNVIPLWKFRPALSLLCLYLWLVVFVVIVEERLIVRSSELRECRLVVVLPRLHIRMFASLVVRHVRFALSIRVASQ